MICHANPHMGMFKHKGGQYMTRRFDVVWETDGNNVCLPEVVTIPDGVEDVANYLSDKYGWLVSTLTEV